MMKCPNCSNEVEVGIKFCTHCGTKMETENRPEAAATVETTQAVTQQENPHLKMTKEMGIQYYQFVLKVLRRPFKVAKEVTEKDFINGIISLLLMALFVPLYSFTLAKKITFSRITFFDGVIKPFFVLAIILAVIAGIIFGVSLLMKAEVTFKTIIAKLGSLTTISSLLFLLAAFFLWLSVYVFSGFLLSAGFLVFLLAITATLFALPATKGLDVVYGVIITFIGIVIVLAILGDSMVGRMSDNLFRFGLF